MSDFDRDVANLNGDEDTLDPYFDQASPTKKAGATNATDDDEEDADDQPSVEKELAEKEAGHFDEKAGEKKKKEKVEETEDAPKSDLDFIEEAAEEVEAERDALLAQDEEEV